MILNGCTMPGGCALLNPRAGKPAPRSLLSACFPHFSVKAALLGPGSSWAPYMESNSRLSSGGCLGFSHLSASSSPLLSGDYGGFAHVVPSLPRRRRTHLCPQAAKDIPTSFRYPPMTKKPRWWWRTLACVPYLLPLHESWMFADTAYNLFHFFEHLEYLTYPFLEVMGTLPKWFLLAYFIVGYLMIVRRKEWPHFFRFHLVTGMLLEIGFQVTGLVTKWLPEGLYWGKVGMHFWGFIALAHLFTVLECIRCALCGMYADVPFVSDAAYIQMPYD